MPYIKAVTKAGNTLIIEKYYSSRWHKKGVERSANLRKTTEAQEKSNLRKAERKLTVLLNANFAGGDYHLVLDYRPDSRPPTPRGGPWECKALPSEVTEDLPESGRRSEICGSVRVWKEGSTPPPYRIKSKRKYIHKRHTGKMGSRKGSLQLHGRQRGILQTGRLPVKKQKVLEGGRRKRQAVFKIQESPCAGDQKDDRPNRERVLRKTKGKEGIPDRPGQ